MVDFDYENDWAGEIRNDPKDGNTYVLRGIEDQMIGGPVVIINDVFGGHSRYLDVFEWVKWSKPDAEFTEVS